MNAIASFPAGRIQGGFRRAWLVWTMGLLSVAYLGGLSLPGDSATAVVNLWLGLLTVWMPAAVCWQTAAGCCPPQLPRAGRGGGFDARDDPGGG